MENVAFLEVLFGALAVLGLIFSYLNIHDTAYDLRAMRELGIRNGRHFVAKHLLLAETNRAGIQLIHLAVAVLAMLLAPAPPLPDGIELPLKVTVFGYLIEYGLTLSAAMVGALSAHAWWWRRAYPATALESPDSAVLGRIDETLGKMAVLGEEAEERRLENPAGDLDIARDHSKE